MSAPAPMAVLLAPIVLAKSASSPLAVLLSPVVLAKSAEPPVAVLLLPCVLRESAWDPMAVLEPPLISLNRARRPVAVFWLPAVRWLSASKPVPVFQTPAVRLTSTPIPSPLLEPGMVPSVSGPTACALGKSVKQTSTSGMRSPAIAGRIDFLTHRIVVLRFLFESFISIWGCCVGLLQTEFGRNAANCQSENYEIRFDRQYVPTVGARRYRDTEVPPTFGKAGFLGAFLICSARACAEWALPRVCAPVRAK